MTHIPCTDCRCTTEDIKWAGGCPMRTRSDAERACRTAEALRQLKRGTWEPPFELPDRVVPEPEAQTETFHVKQVSRIAEKLRKAFPQANGSAKPPSDRIHTLCIIGWTSLTWIVADIVLWYYLAVAP